MLLCRGTANALATCLITAVTRRWGKRHTDLVVQVVLHMNMAKVLYVSEMSLHNKGVLNPVPLGGEVLGEMCMGRGEQDAVVLENIECCLVPARGAEAEQGWWGQHCGSTAEEGRQASVRTPSWREPGAHQPSCTPPH